VPADDRGVRRSRSGWCETQIKPPKSHRSAQSPLWQRWFDRSHELELAAALEDGGRTGKDRGGELVVRGPAVSIREVLDAAGLASIVDEVETTEVEMTHD
jgi:hypothetical protein